MGSPANSRQLDELARDDKLVRSRCPSSILHWAPLAYYNIPPLTLTMAMAQLNPASLTVCILLLVVLASGNTPTPQHYIDGYLQQGDPIKIVIQIGNLTHQVYNQSIELLYSLNQPELTIPATVPVHPKMDNLTMLVTLWSQKSHKAISQSTQNLTRYARIRNKESTSSFSMEMEGVPSGPDPNSEYGMHIAVRFMLLVLYADYPIPLNRDYFNMFNIKADYYRNRRGYILPIDISQMHIPYKTYKPITQIHNTSHQLLLTVKPFSLTYYQFFYGLTNRQFLQRANPLLAQVYTEETIDLIKETLFDNNFYLVVTYFLLCFIQFFMQIFAFKNQIQVWKAVENKPGLSIKNLYQRLLFQAIVCLYLYEKSANRLFLGFQILDLILTCWKITRALEISLSSKNKYFLSIGYKEWYHRKVETADSQALHYTNYLLVALLVPFMAYKLYPVVGEAWLQYNNEQLRLPGLRVIYMFLLQTAVLFIFVFGFVMMTPQLYINYKLKSVDHLPWKTLIYRFIYTIIDDIFVFMIDLPWLQRMFSFRDDVVFVLYLVQRRIYRVDPGRLATSRGSVQLPVGAGTDTQAGTQAIPQHIKAE